MLPLLRVVIIGCTFSDQFVDHHRQMIGIDGLTTSPVDIHGMEYADVIKVCATNLVVGSDSSWNVRLLVFRALSDILSVQDTLNVS